MRNSVIQTASLVVLIMLLAASCSSDGSTSLDASRIVPTAVVQPTLAPLPTTEPVLVPPDPVPTPITLAGGQGIAAPAAGSDATDGSDDADAGLADDQANDDPSDGDAEGDYNDAAVAGDADDDYNDAAVAGSDTTDPEPTAAPQPPPATTAPAPTAAPAPQVATAQSIANGAEVYALQCARCHGASGEGVISGPLLFIGSRYDAPTMINELTNGHAFTFGFADKLSATEISNVVDFVLSEFG